MIMLNKCILLPQYKNSPPKAQTTAFKNSLLKIGCPEVYIRVHFQTRVFARQKHRCCVEPRTSLSALEVQGAYGTDCAAYFQKILDIKIVGTTITQQLSNSATQQLSNSATQQLRRKVCLRPDKRATFSFRQQHHYFSSIFADGTSGASVFTFTHRRYFAVLGIFCALGMQRSRFCKHIINTAFYRRNRPAVCFDSG